MKVWNKIKKVFWLIIDINGILLLLGYFWYFKTDKKSDYQRFKEEEYKKRGER